MSVNGIVVNGSQMEDGRDVFEVIANSENYPLSLKFGRPKMTLPMKQFS